MKKKLKKTLILTGIAVVAVLVITTICLAVWLNWQPTDLENRAIVIVFELNGDLTDDDLQFYQEHKKLADFFLINLLGVERADLESKDILSVMDDSVDVKMSEMMKRFAKGYGKIVVLTGETAVVGNFVKTMAELDKEGYITDVVTFVHGNSGNLYFESDLVSGSALLKALGKLNLGFVYQINCYGRSNVETWLNMGAQVVSGSEGINSLSIIAPELVIRAMVWGKPFGKAVDKAYTFEAGFWKIAKVFVPGIFWTDENSLEASKPFLAGDLDYKIKKFDFQ